MTREERAAHVAEIEKRFAPRPAALRLRIVWLALLGYAGLLSWLGIVCLIAAFFLVLGMQTPLENGGWFLLLVGGLILIFGGWAVLRVLWVRLTPPDGRVVTRREVPALFAMLDDLRRRLGASGFHRVLISGDCNAGVTEIPRLGMFGWPRHYLQIGLPLLECLSASEVRAVLAHEFAHLSSRHGRLTNWLYRLRRSWAQMFEGRQQHRPGTVSFRPLVDKFIEWFWPRFDSHAFVLSRWNEFQADAMAAWVAGAEPMADALYRTAVYGRLLNERFWPDLWQRANVEPAPPTGVYDTLRATVRTAPSAEDDAKWRAQAFKFVTSNSDTHPCLTARLRKIKRLPETVAEGEFPPWPPIHEPNGAETLLGPALPRIRADVEARWRKECGKNWTDRHDRAAALQHRLQSLSQAVPEPGADVDSLWDQARAIMDLQSIDVAAPILRQILALRPDHVPANYYLGRQLIEAVDPAGQAYLEQAMEHDEDVVPQACGLLHTYFRVTGQPARVKEIETRLDRHDAAMAASQTERANVTAADTLIPHALDDAQLENVRALLAAQRGVATAFLAQKKMRHFPKQRLFVLCVQGERAWYRLPNRDAEQAAVNALFGKVRLPGRVLVCAPSGSFAALARKVRSVPHARIFPRTEGELRSAPTPPFPTAKPPATPSATAQ